MLVGQRLRELCESKDFSQGDLEKRTGLLRCYTSRIENGHTVPSIETLEKYAKALEIPVYKFFYDGDDPPKKLKLFPESAEKRGTKGEERSEVRTFAKLLAKMNERDRTLLPGLAQRMSSRSKAE
jgi:transcriptional regulator with XRE-family HTH domain